MAAAIVNYGNKTISWYDMDFTGMNTPTGTTVVATIHQPPTQHTAFLWDLNSPNVVKPPNYPGGTNTADLPVNGHFPTVNFKYDSIDGTPPDPTRTGDTSLSMGGGGITTTTGEPHDNRDGWITGCSFFGNTTATYNGLWFSGYRGFYDMAQPAIDKKFINKKHQPIDAWKQPLRIAFAANTYGAGWFGVWSAGPDLTDDTPDDIQSWTTHAGN